MSEHAGSQIVATGARDYDARDALAALIGDLLLVYPAQLSALTFALCTGALQHWLETTGAVKMCEQRSTGHPQSAEPAVDCEDSLDQAVDSATEAMVTQSGTASTHTLRLFALIKKAIVSHRLEFALLDHSAEKNTILIWHGGSQKIIARIVVFDHRIDFVPEFAKDDFEPFSVTHRSTDFITQLSGALRAGLPNYEMRCERAIDGSPAAPPPKLVDRRDRGT